MNHMTKTIQPFKGRLWTSLPNIQSTQQFAKSLTAHQLNGGISFLIPSTSKLVWFLGMKTQSHIAHFCEVGILPDHIN